MENEALRAFRCRVMCLRLLVLAAEAAFGVFATPAVAVADEEAVPAESPSEPRTCSRPPAASHHQLAKAQRSAPLPVALLRLATSVSV